MTTVLSEREPVAKKAFHCMASDFICESGILYEGCLNFSEYRQILKAKNNKWQIFTPGVGY